MNRRAGGGRRAIDTGNDIRTRKQNLELRMLAGLRLAGGAPPGHTGLTESKSLSGQITVLVKSGCNSDHHGMKDDRPGNPLAIVTRTFQPGAERRARSRYFLSQLFHSRLRLELGLEGVTVHIAHRKKS